MTALDDALRPVAQRLINQYGKQVTYTRASQDVDYDPDSGTQEQSTDDETVLAIVSGFSAFEMKQGLIENGDLKLMIYDMDPPPTNADSFTVDGVGYSVVNVTPEYTGEQRGFFMIQARRA